jgi:gamma-glutamylputrescine oxidase
MSRDDRPNLSFWQADAVTSLPTLSGETNADVAIIGAGFTGLSTALALREEGLSVVVLERDVVGGGASGRNCGQVGADLGKSLVSLRRYLGLERAREAVSLLRAAIDHVEELIRTYDIDCEYEATGNVFAGVHSSQERFIQRAARTAESLGVSVRLLSSTDLRQMDLPESVVCGYQERIGGALHPGKYVAGLKRAALAAGASIFERSGVVRIEQGRELHVHTPRGRVRSRYCVLATNAYTPSVGWLRRTILPAVVSAVVTAPLNGRQRERLGWSGREPIYTSHHVLENLRWTHDGRILVGTKRVRIGPAGRLPPTNEERSFVDLENVLRMRFPQLHDVAISHRWSGYVALTPDFLPVFGRTGRFRNILYAGGYGGHGISLASYAGRILSDLLSERELGPARVLVERRVPPLPPEPLLSSLARTVLWAMRKADDRLDRRARRIVL